jgi:hypothetical protein
LRYDNDSEGVEAQINTTGDKWRIEDDVYIFAVLATDSMLGAKERTQVAWSL